MIESDLFGFRDYYEMLYSSGNGDEQSTSRRLYFFYIREDRSIGDQSIGHKSVELSLVHPSPLNITTSSLDRAVLREKKCHLILISNRQDTEAFVASRKCN